MSARDDYGAFVAYLAGPLTGMNGDIMEIQVACALDEIDRLRAWKFEATAVIEGWHELEALVPAEFTAGKLGQSWPTVIAAYLESLRAERSNRGPR